MKDKKAIKHLNKLGEYCSNPERALCEGCVFRNIRYEGECPIVLSLELTKDLRNERKEYMKVYISGPITGINDYLEKFNKAEEYLTEQGYTVINPAKVNSNLPSDTSHDNFIKMCYVMLDMANSIYMLPDWEKE